MATNTRTTHSLLVGYIYDLWTLNDQISLINGDAR
jgi:hypothetical protein